MSLESPRYQSNRKSSAKRPQAPGEKETEIRGHKARSLKKRRGIYYTPLEVANVLTEWGIRKSTDTVLEPSFGGGGFISAIKTKLMSLGNCFPANNVYGCDIDAGAFKRHLSKEATPDIVLNQFIKADFLSLNPDIFQGTKFDLIIGNPPYVSQHNMFKKQREVAELAGSDKYFRLSGMSSLWAYFVFHSLGFLKPEGRMAWLLPASMLHARYARELIDEMAFRFKRVGIISLNERIFTSSGTDERTEILLCENFKLKRIKSKISIIEAKSLKECQSLLDGWHASLWQNNILTKRPIPSILRAGELNSYSFILENFPTFTIGEVAKVKIGQVTGANRLFVVNTATASQHQIPQEALKDIFSKIDISPGITLKLSDFVTARSTGIRCLLIDGTHFKRLKSLQAYFGSVPEQVIRENITFGKRRDWRIIPDDGIPDAFISYMHHNSPRFIINESKANATNTIHRVYFKDDSDPRAPLLIALGMLTSFSQLSSEIEGRRYGAGVLKHEVGETKAISILNPERLDYKELMVFTKKVDMLFRSGHLEVATKIVDDFFYDSLGIEDKHRCNLVNSLNLIRRMRFNTK